MNIHRHARTLLTGLLVMGTLGMTRADAGPLDGLAGAAVGFALGTMVAPRPVYAAPRARRVVVYRNRPARAHYAATPARRRSGAGAGGASISTVSDPFANSSSAKPIPVSAR